MCSAQLGCTCFCSPLDPVLPAQFQGAVDMPGRRTSRDCSALLRHVAVDVSATAPLSPRVYTFPGIVTRRAWDAGMAAWDLLKAGKDR